jgi:TolB-like protein
MKKICCILVAVAMTCFVSGCTKNFTLNKEWRSLDPPETQQTTETAGKFNDKMMTLAVQLDKNAVNRNAQNTFIVTSFTNLDKLSETTSLGRLIAENLMHGLQVHKWQVFEVRLTKGIDINEAGEFSLSRDISKLKDEYKISGIVTGTYSVAEGNLTINARVIDINSGIVLSSAQSYIPLNWVPETLLPYETNKNKMKIVNDGIK